MKNILKTIISIPVIIVAFALLASAFAGAGSPEEASGPKAFGGFVLWLISLLLNIHHMDWYQEREERRHQLELAKASAPVIKTDDRSQMSKLIGMLLQKKPDVIRGRCTHCGSSDIEIERVV